ncbi:MAG: preprotein translocase subunit SecE [Oscillospiraceae bacterium]|nr:preprotein translocase subunit SecE [Oscillospiraceae bacterium]
MANEEKKPVAQAKGGAVKRTNEKLPFFQRIKKWFREMRSELKKVVWPTPKQIGKNTLVALVMMAVSAIVLGGFDWLAGAAVRALMTLVG